MSEMMLSIFSGHVSLIIPTANQKLCLVSALLPYQNTNLIFSDILVKVWPNYCQTANQWICRHWRSGGYLFSVHKKSKQLSRRRRNRGCIKIVNVSSLIPLCLFVCVMSKSRGGTPMWNGSQLLLVSLRPRILVSLSVFLTKTLPFYLSKCHIGCTREIIIQKRSPFRL